MDKDEISIDSWFKKKITLSRGTLFIGLVMFATSFFLIKWASTSAGFHGGDAQGQGLEIEALIRKVKTELMKADSDRVKYNEDPLFQLKSFQMEISFTVRQEIKEGAKADYKFVTIEGGSDIGNEKIQKLTLNWEAIASKPDTFGNTEMSPAVIKKITPK